MASTVWMDDGMLPFFQFGYCPVEHSICQGGIRVLKNKHYLEDIYHPAIIDWETFDNAEQERMRRLVALGGIKESTV